MQKQVFGYQTLLVLFVKRCEPNGGNFAAPHSEETGSQSGYLQWVSLGRTGQQYGGVDWTAGVERQVVSEVRPAFLPFSSSVTKSRL